MKSINYQVVPSTMEEDYNSSKTVWKDGKIQSLDEGNYVTMFIGHKTVKTVDDAGVEHEVTEAFPVRVQKPYSLDKAVMAGVMNAYGLLTSQDYAALSEEIERKRRINVEDASVKEYDILVDWIRGCLDGTYKSRVDEVRARVLAEIESYDKSDKVNSFTLDGDDVWLDKATRVGLMNSTQIEKSSGHDETVLWFGGKSYTIPCDLAIQMLSALEMYALECYNVTARHKAEIDSLQTIEEVENYDYKTGYPDKLDLKTK